MPSKAKFKQSTLVHSMHLIFKMQGFPKLICSSFLISSCISVACAQEQVSDLSKNETIEQPTTTVDSDTVQETTTFNTQLVNALPSSNINVQDSLDALKQQEQSVNQINELKPIQLDDNLEDLPTVTVDQNMADEIFRVAEEAKNDAKNYRDNPTKTSDVLVNDASQAELTEITKAPVNIDQLMQEIQTDSKIVVEANELGRTLPELQVNDDKKDEKVGFFKRIWNRLHPDNLLNAEKIPRISADVSGAPAILATNIKAKLSTFTQESFEDFNVALPQLRSLTNQAAQAVGYYNAEFKFEKVSDSKVKVNVTPNEPVKIKEQNIEFSGVGENLPQLQVLRLIPEQDEGDIFNHGKYEETKTKIVSAATDNGFFDAYWRLHDVKITQPDKTAEINLKYETGDRYKLKKVEYRMSDPSKPLPLTQKVLDSLAPWKEDDDYAFWRVNALANNLTNTRYFNYTLVDTIKPDPIQPPLELAPDLQALVDQQNIQQSQLMSSQQKADLARQKVVSAEEVTQDVVDESQFSGGESQQYAIARAMPLSHDHDDEEEERQKLEEQTRIEKKIPVVVTLNADRLNSLETGLGYGTDTGARIRSQYRRAIVNKYGHAFDANIEVSQIRQSIDGRYSIPYKHPLNDYFNLVGGYEREERDDIGPDVNLLVESAVLGGERVIKNPLGDWQHTMGVRYRLDRLTKKGDVDVNELPDAFKVSGMDSEQESLLFGYELSKTNANSRLNPTKGFKQTYKVELGTESLLSDANMAILTAGWRFIYSLGENDDHQFVGRGDASYIFTDDFNKVPYNLRFFTGGDQSLRGFDYKSLSPEENGYKIGGQALGVGSLEYNYQFKDGWRAAIFSDFGNAYDKDFNNPTEYSIGVGIRWRSPIGPIRLDVASGISNDNNPIRLHFFIGPQL
ncbi:autotransporter assembly complex protein TamA [Acinetobacter venetianus]|uniref:autotransporter assembly complex protein TamA n=1 Tax=Acinetobacter venetianus TaxID=52133 RepID=UPI0010A5FC85|nr:BamA/TamA family outer membrane protein [Acinetobacter venetianus]MCR4531398.1 BamA/TamA family outer membrane protein [Acinetobacter venetianus]MDA0695465.1 BamA/TamA family outer membrane protein [Pseudomonadota bacterium]MDA1253410.1 BamA/TamA family outer membrane protein [Pseudomonadota bacterium]